MAIALSGLFAGALSGGLAGTAVAADVARAGNVMIHQPWARASIGNAPNSAVYMTLETMGEEPDRLVGGATPVAEKAQLHNHLMEGGIAKMRPVDAVEIAPGAPTVLEPGGLHLMLIGLKQKLEEGATMPLTLVFETAGEVTLDVPVLGIAGSRGQGGHGSMEHEAPATN
jgi:copper(I)-binding protein